MFAFIIGAMAIFAGGKVFLGHMPDYYVIGWLPVYNFTVGVISASVTAIQIWKNSSFAMPAAVATLSAHVLVMIIIQSIYGDVVARESTTAMTVRIVAWIIILALLLVRQRYIKSISLEGSPR